MLPESYRMRMDVRVVLCAVLTACCVLPALGQPRPAGPAATAQPAGPGPGLKLSADPEQALPELFTALVQAVDSGNLAPVGNNVAEGCLVIMDGEVKGLADFARAPGQGGAGREVQVTPDQVVVTSRCGLLWGKATVGDADSVSLVGAAVEVEGRWRALLMALNTDATTDGEVPAEAQAILDDIETEGDTGMQAALGYLGAGPALFAVAIGDFPIIMPGSEAIRGQVGQWASPQNVTVAADPITLVAPGCVVRGFASDITNDNQSRQLQNVVVVIRTNAGWRIPAFVAAFEPAPEPPPGTEPAPADEEGGETDEGVQEPVSPVGPI